MRNMTIAVMAMALVLMFAIAFINDGIEAREQMFDVRSRMYPRAGIVWEVDREGDFVTVEDGAGILWSFSGAEDWEVGDMAAMILWDNFTTDFIFDDEVVEVRFAGHFAP